MMTDIWCGSIIFEIVDAIVRFLKNTEKEIERQILNFQCLSFCKI